MCCRIEAAMTNVAGHLLRMLLCLVTYAFAASATYGQESPPTRRYDHDIRSLNYKVDAYMHSDGRHGLRLYLIEEIAEDWRVKRDLKILWKREAVSICGALRPAGRSQPFGPTWACDGITSAGRRTGDCNVWAGIAGTFKCK